VKWALQEKKVTKVVLVSMAFRELQEPKEISVDAVTSAGQVVQDQKENEDQMVLEVFKEREDHRVQ